MADLKKTQGFTLIEVMIALAVLMIGLVGIIGVQIAGIHQLAQAKQRTTASLLGVQVMEHLKNVPINPNNPDEIFSDYLGNQLVDADGKALLSDAVVGDGLLTWHRLPPMSSDGRFMPAGGPWSSEYFYLVIYGVEWGGASGSQSLSAPDNKPLTLAKYPDTIPAANQIYIEVWAGWVDPGQRPQLYNGNPLNQIIDYYNAPIVDAGSPGAPQVDFKRKVVLKTIRGF